MKIQTKNKWIKLVLSDKSVIKFHQFAYSSHLKRLQDCIKHQAWQLEIIGTKIDTNQISNFKSTYDLSSYGGKQVDTIDSKSIALKRAGSNPVKSKPFVLR